MIFRSSSARNYFLSKLLATAIVPLAWAVGIASVGITCLATLLAERTIINLVIPAGA